MRVIFNPAFSSCLLVRSSSHVQTAAMPLFAAFQDRLSAQARIHAEPPALRPRAGARAGIEAHAGASVPLSKDHASLTAHALRELCLSGLGIGICHRMRIQEGTVTLQQNELQAFAHRRILAMAACIELLRVARERPLPPQGAEKAM